MAASDFERAKSAEQIEITVDGRGARAEWHTLPVFPTKDSVEDDSGFPVAINDAHPDYSGSSLKCDRITISRRGVSNAWSVIASYSEPEGGGDHKTNKPTNPLAEPVRIRWEKVQYQYAVDRDLSGNPIAVQPGRVPQNLPTRTINAQRAVFTKNLASYSATLSLDYENHLNSATFLGGAVKTVRCTGIIPSEEYDADFTYVKVAHEMEYRSTDVWGDYPHEQPFWRMDTKAVAVFSDGSDGLVTILGGDNLPLSTPIMLDRSGIPIPPTGASLGYYDPILKEPIPAADVSWVSQSLPPGASLIPSGALSGDPVQLVYETLPTADFSALNL